MWGEPWGDFSMTINRAPRRIDTTGDFVDIACGAFHNLALNSAGCGKRCLSMACAGRWAGWRGVAACVFTP